MLLWKKRLRTHSTVVELVLACLARNSPTYCCAVEDSPMPTPLPVEEATEDSQTVQRSWSLHVQLGTPLLTAVQLKIDCTSHSPKRSPSSTASPKRSPPSPRKKILILLLPSFPFYILVNHIAEYVSLIFSNVESFAHKAPVAFNCRFEI